MSLLSLWACFLQSPSAVLNINDGDQVTGGMVCEALTLMAAGRLNLRPGSVKVYLLLSASPPIGVLTNTTSLILDTACFLNLKVQLWPSESGMPIASKHHASLAYCT